MTDIVEGRRAVTEALRSGATVSTVLIAENVKSTAAIDELIELATQRGVRVERRARREIERMSPRGAHQGVVAVVAPFAYTPLAEVIRRSEGQERVLVLALDHVTDPHNLGAVARSAEVAGAGGLVIEKRRSAGVGPAAFKASAGAVAHLPVVAVTNLVRAIAELKEAGFWVAGASEDAPALAWDAPMEGRLVIVLGAEDRGLSRLVAESCDFLVGLPVAGHVGSLNVAQAATVLAYEWVRRAPRS